MLTVDKISKTFSFPSKNLTAYFPKEYTGALMNGQGLAGLTVALTSILTSLAQDRADVCEDDTGKGDPTIATLSAACFLVSHRKIVFLLSLATGDDDSCIDSINYSALAYFSIATSVLVSCVLAFQVLKKLTITK